VSTPDTQVAIRDQHRSLVDAIRHPKMQEQIKASLPPSVSLDRFTATTISALNHNPDLLSADRQSFYNAVVKAASDGLLPDGIDSVLNIYSTNVGTRDKPRWIDKVQYQRMVGGIIKQFAKAGIHAYAVSVYECELPTFELWNDEEGQHIRHNPKPFEKNRGERLGAFAVAKLTSGRVIIETMNVDDLARAKAASKSGDRGPWKTWPERMEQKSVLHRLRKRVAIIDEVAAAELNKIDDEFEEETPEPTPAPAQQQAPSEPEKRPSALQAIVDQEAAAKPLEAPTGPADDPGPQEGDII
jgi:recombination protein RecT